MSALPATVPAMLASLTQDRFSDRDWFYERKLDGVRCLARRTRSGRVRLSSRNDKELTGTFPEIAQALAEQTESALLVDGEIVALTGRLTSSANAACTGSGRSWWPRSGSPSGPATAGCATRGSRD